MQRNTDMKQLFKPLLIMIFGLLTACTEDEITPTFSSFEKWNQSGIGKTWYYNYQNEFIGTTGGLQSKLIATGQNF
jgi:hypothetical protein